MDKHELFKDVIAKFNNCNWKIVFDATQWQAKIVNDKGEEIDLKSLNFILAKLGDYAQRMNEEHYGEKRKEPLDEFTKRRLGLKDYTLLWDEVLVNTRYVFEAYHDSNGIFTIDNYSISLENNLKYYDSGFKAHLTEFDVEKLLEPLQNFVSLHSKTSEK
ncbi:hypothetical protein ACFOU2_00200 [Bacillus songklensis]|uniref:Uncharacterized protein n=1 Tax=Bacillus songklensis TaxID=1069116 RepID=A0ABV8AYW7_9BACI